MQLAHTITIEGAHTVNLHQRADGKFRVTYGSEVHDDLSYIRAAEELGYCVFHALACAGQITDKTDHE